MTSIQFIIKNTAGYKSPIRERAVQLAVFLWVLAAIAHASDAQIQSTWDKSLPSQVFHDVFLRTNRFVSVLRELSDSYLLRVNVYIDVDTYSDSTTFSLRRSSATGREIVEAILAAYPEYGYTQDTETGVIWIHPKRIKYTDILNQKVRIEHQAFQISAYTDVLRPLNDLLFPRIGVPSPGGYGGIPSAWCYGVDLPAGVISVRQVLNLCCVANPTKAFEVGPPRPAMLRASPVGDVNITLRDLLYQNPLAPPRAAAVAFWEYEIGRTTSGTPTIGEVVAAMSSYNPQRRWAARVFQEATQLNYPLPDILRISKSPEEAVWVVLGAMGTLFSGSDLDSFKHMERQFPRIAGDVRHVKDPRLALLVSLELAKEGSNSGHLDAIVSKHEYSESEIASIRSDIYRIAFKSKLAVNKLKSMRLKVSEFSPQTVGGLERTNLFTPVPLEKK